MLLCIDIGNTDTDLYLIGDLDKMTILDTLVYSTKENQSYELIKKRIYNFITLNKIDDVIISSVAPSLNEYYNRLFKEILNINIMFVTYDKLSNVLIDTLHPEETGADLYCDVVGAVSKYGCPVLVVDVGTATKLLYTNEESKFTGAVIAPGLIGSLNSLFTTTELLESFDLKQATKTLGNDTISCITSGAVIGHFAMIDGMIERIKEEVNNNELKVVITGGLGRMYQLLKSPVDYDPYVLTYGMIAIYKENKGEK